MKRKDIKKPARLSRFVKSFDRHSQDFQSTDIEGNRIRPKQGIVLVNLLAYSSNLNPIVRIWKQVKIAIR